MPGWYGASSTCASITSCMLCKCRVARHQQLLARACWLADLTVHAPWPCRGMQARPSGTPGRSSRCVGFLLLCGPRTAAGPHRLATDCPSLAPVSWRASEGSLATHAVLSAAPTGRNLYRRPRRLAACTWLRCLCDACPAMNMLFFGQTGAPPCVCLCIMCACVQGKSQEGAMQEYIELVASL